MPDQTKPHVGESPEPTTVTFNYACQRPLQVKENVWVRCNSRLLNRCKGCAALAQGDWRRIAWSGINDAPESSKFYMLTLTAPSFGATHRVAKQGEEPRPCQCGTTHNQKADEGLRGVPLNLENYDYRSAVEWNYNAPVLLANFIRSLKRKYPEIAYLSVREWQHRGVLHFHVFLRTEVTLKPEDVERCAKSATTTGQSGRSIVFGSRLDLAAINPTETPQIVGYPLKTLGYQVRYIDKSVITEDATTEHQRRLHEAAQRSIICPGNRGVECQLEDCRSAVHRQWGAKSAAITTSRGKTAWSLNHTTRRSLRNERKDWARNDAALVAVIEVNGAETTSYAVPALVEEVPQVQGNHPRNNSESPGPWAPKSGDESPPQPPANQAQAHQPGHQPLEPPAENHQDGPEPEAPPPTAPKIEWDLETFFM